MPENILKKLEEKILPEWRAAFFASLLVGFLAHFYKITSWLPNWDSLVFRYSSQNMVALGRWFLPVVCAPSSFYELPFFNGIISILFHALSAPVIVATLKIKKKTTAALVGALVISFPTVISVMSYAYVADGYAISFFLATLSAYLLTLEKPKFLVATLLIALSTGIYQAYITVVIMLLLLRLFDEALYGDIPFSALLKKTLIMLLSGALGMALYAIVMKVTLALSGSALLDYQGLGDAASLSSIDISGSLYKVFETLRQVFFDFSKGVNIYNLQNLFIALFTLIFYFIEIVVRKAYKKPERLIFILLVALLLPLGAGALAFINPTIDYHSLMQMGYLVFYLFFLLIYERGERGVKIKSWTVLLVATLLISSFIVLANVSYHKAQLAYERSYGVLIRIADRIESVSGSEECERIAVLGHLEGSEAYSVTFPPTVTGITDGYIIRADDEVVAQSVLTSALSDYCMKDYDFLSGEEKKRISESDVALALEPFPSKNCVGIEGDVLIIKLGGGE